MREMEKLMGISSDRKTALAVLYGIYIIVLAILAWMGQGTDCRTFMTGTLIGTTVIMDTELFLFAKTGYGQHTFDELLSYYPADILTFIPSLLRKALIEGIVAWGIAALLAFAIGKPQNFSRILLMNLRAPAAIMYSWLISWYAFKADYKKKDITGCSFEGAALTVQVILLLVLLIGGAIFKW